MTIERTFSSVSLCVFVFFGLFCRGYFSILLYEVKRVARTSVWEGRAWKSYEDEIQSTTRKYNKKNNLEPYHLESVLRFKRNTYTT